MAHAAGLAHLCLTPHSLRWTSGGGVKVLGVAIDAALSDITADDPGAGRHPRAGHAAVRRADQALAGAGTGRTLPPAPLADGLPRSPRQVRAGVPAGIDDVTCQALFQQERRRGPPLTTPALFAEALFEVIPAPLAPPAGRRPAAGPAQPPDSFGGPPAAYGSPATAAYRSGDRRPGLPASRRLGAPGGGGDAPGPAAAPGRCQPGRGIVLIALLVVAAIGAGVYTLTRTGGGTGAAGHPGSSAHNSAPASSGTAVLKPVSAGGYDALGLARTRATRTMPGRRWPSTATRPPPGTPSSTSAIPSSAA